MQASIDIIESDINANNLDDFCLPDPADDVQASIDRLLDYFSENAQYPVIKASGSVIAVAVEIGKQFEYIAPVTLKNDTDIVLEHIIKCLGAYCETARVYVLAFQFRFQRGAGDV